MQLTVIQNKIYEIRSQKVMLDFDLAEMYEVETKVLNQAVKRNANRFPKDFMFILTRKEFQSLRSQIVTSNRGGTRYLPSAFTEQGVAKDLRQKINKLEKKYNSNFKEIFNALNLLLTDKQQKEDFAKRERIGFKKDKSTDDSK